MKRGKRSLSLDLNQLREMEDQVAEAMLILNGLNGGLGKRSSSSGGADLDEEEQQSVSKRMGAGGKGGNLNQLEGDLEDALGLFNVSNLSMKTAIIYILRTWLNLSILSFRNVTLIRARRRDPVWATEAI